MGSKKAMTLLDIPDDYVSLDLETTGFDYYFCDIIEAAAVRVRNNKIVDEFHTLINPQCEIDDFIAELTGISNEMVAGAPLLTDIIQDFMTFIDDDIIVAHNVTFDVNFLSQKLRIMKMPVISNCLVDTLRLSRWFFKELPNHKLDTIINAFNIETANRHRALSDSIAVKQVIDAIHNHIIINEINLDEYFKDVRSGYKLDARDITTDVTEFDIEHPLYNRNVVFTGTLEKMVRKEAMQLVTDLGGICQNGINKDTNILILGNNDYCSTIKDGKSSKHKKAEECILKGQDLIIISENTFYDMV